MLPLVARAISSPLATEVLAGYVAGSAKILAFYPLDTATTLRETRTTTASASAPLLQVYFSGVGITLLGALPYAILFHFAFWLCERLLASSTLPTAAVKLWASTGGAIFAALVGVPFECIKHRVQLGKATGREEWSTPRKALAATMRGSGGVRGLYTGLRSTLARNVPYNALNFGLFETFSSLLSARAWPVVLCSMIAGALAGALTALVTTPLDVINTRLQVRTPDMERDVSPAELVAQMWREEGGPAAFMQGAGVRVAQYAPSALVFFAVYQFIKR